MRRPVIFSLGAFVFVCAASILAEEKILTIGDRAPAIDVSSWVKGDKVEKFEPGKTYVVEFWATWCGPCKRVMPHLSELAHQYKDQVQFIGVNIWEHDPALVKPFMDKMADKMDYTVALDRIPDGKTETEGAMAKTWMKTAEEEAIPKAFIIRDGKIQWIGVPTTAIDDVLAKVVAGTWEGTPEENARLAQKERLHKVNDINTRLTKVLADKDYRSALKIVEEESVNDSYVEGMFRLSRCIWLCRLGEVDQAVAICDKTGAESWNNPRWLRFNANGLLLTNEEGDLDPRVSKVALKFAERALELTEEKFPSLTFQYLTTLADVQSRSSEAASAAVTEKKAIEALKKQLSSDTSALKQKLAESEKRLENFLSAAAEKTKTSEAP